MTERMQKIMAGLVVALLMLVIVLTLVIQWGDDGALLLSNDAGTLSIVATIIIALGYFVSDAIKSRNFTDGYGRLIDKLTDNVVLADSLELKYLAMPEGLPKKAIDLFADIAQHLVKMTPTEVDDRLAEFLDQIRDGKPNEG